MVELKCGCEVTKEGKFVLGEGCKTRNCSECKSMVELHPFGNERFMDLFWTKK